MSILNQKKNEKTAAVHQPKQANADTRKRTGDLYIRMNEMELNNLMNWFLDQDAGIKIFLMLDQRIKEAKETIKPTSGN